MQGQQRGEAHPCRNRLERRDGVDREVLQRVRRLEQLPDGVGMQPGVARVADQHRFAGGFADLHAVERPCGRSNFELRPDCRPFHEYAQFDVLAHVHGDFPIDRKQVGAQRSIELFSPGP